MKTRPGDMIAEWEGFDAICIPTNGVLRGSGSGVMGAGLARIARNLWGVGLERALGKHVAAHTNTPCLLHTGKTTEVWSFPTKHHWRDPSSLDLIRNSARWMVYQANERGWKKVALPEVGCGLGGLLWGDVKPHLDQILDDRFTVLHYKEDYHVPRLSRPCCREAPRPSVRSHQERLRGLLQSPAEEGGALNKDLGGVDAFYLSRLAFDLSCIFRYLSLHAVAFPGTEVVIPENCEAVIARFDDTFAYNRHMVQNEEIRELGRVLDQAVLAVLRAQAETPSLVADYSNHSNVGN